MSDSAPRVAIVALPWLDVLLEALRPVEPRPVLPNLDRLAARASRRILEASGWRSHLIAGLPFDAGVLARCPAGPCVAARTVGVRPGVTWACATPVHLAAGLDHLRLSPPERLVLEPHEAADVAGSLNAHFAGTGFEIADAQGRHWLLRCPDGYAASTVEPGEAAGRDLRECLPSGANGRTLMSLVNEIQMLLHDHPVNAQRAQSGRPPVNSLWPWGVGVATRCSPLALPPLATDDAWLAGLWTVHGNDPLPLGGVDEAIGRGRGVRAAMEWPPPVGPCDALLALDEGLGASLHQALAAGRVDEITLQAGGVALRKRRVDRWRIWRRPHSLLEACS